MIINPRRPYLDDRPDGLRESDKDYVLNNIDACVELLDRELRANGVRLAAEAVIAHRKRDCLDNSIEPYNALVCSAYRRADEAVSRPPLHLQRRLNLIPRAKVPTMPVKDKERISPTINAALNLSRANWAEAAVAEHARGSGADEEEKAVQVIDLICNLQHYCRRLEINFDEVLNAARMHFQDETSGY